MDEQHRLESSAELTHLRGLETGVQNGAQGIAVPMAIPHAASREGHERILHPGDDASLRARMFEEQERPSQLEDAPDLTQAALGIMYGTEDEGGHHTLELCIGEWEGLDRGTSECNGKGRYRERASGLYQHDLVRLDRLHALHAGRIALPHKNLPLSVPFHLSLPGLQRRCQEGTRVLMTSGSTTLLRAILLTKGRGS